MICTNCKKEIGDDSRFCKYCGVEFVGEEKIIEVNPGNSISENVEVQPEATVHSAPTVGSPEKQPKRSRKTLAIQLIITFVVLLIICGVLVFVGVSTGRIGGTREIVTDAEGEEIKTGKGTVTMAVADTDGTVRTITSDKTLLTPDAILSEYTAVMNQLKTDSPAFTKLRYQNLPTDHQSFGGLGNLVLPIIEKYVTSKDVAKAAVYTTGNADKLPVYNSSYGCLLSDSSKIKNAYCEILDENENSYKLVITVNDELNPIALTSGATSSQSAISGIFAPYETGTMISGVAELALSNIEFNYTDCTVTLVYDFDSKQVQSVNMTMNIDITATAILSNLSARVVDITEIYSLNYN